MANDKSRADDKMAPPPSAPVFQGEGVDPFRPADNMVLDYDPHTDIQPGTQVGPAVDPNVDGDGSGDDKAKDDEEDAGPKAASMSMTKAELLDCLKERAEGMTKAEIVALIERVDADDDDEGTAEAPRSYATDTRTATIDGQTYTWTEESEATVPQAARDVYAQHKAAGG